MAAFIGLTSWHGEYTPAYFDQPVPDPAQFGMPTEDDGNRSDPLLSGDSAAVTAYVPDLEAIAASPTRLVIAVGEESSHLLPGRAGSALAAHEPTVVTREERRLLSELGGEHGYAGKPEEFAAKLRDVLAG